MRGVHRLAPLLLLAACAGLPSESEDWNPLGWPAKAFSAVGFQAADSELPLVRETGRWLQATGELLDTPALLVEGVVLLDGERVASSGDHLVVGTGSTITATWNLPFFIVPGRTVDLGQDAELVNQALAHLEAQPPESWHTAENDPRTEIFPPGTRVRASGENLIYTIPGHGEVLQSARSNVLWDWLQQAVGTRFPAQERSWGFVVKSREEWNAFSATWRAETILHEFYHQHEQMRVWLKGWTVVYWPAYLATFPFTGWNDHWAERNGPHAAGVVEQACRSWQPE